MKSINVNEQIDKAKFNPFFFTVFLCGLFIIIFDGYDLNIFGVVMPVLMKDTGMNPTQSGLLVSYGLYGMIFGSIFFGWLADKIGRKNVIMLCVAIYCIFTGIAGTGHSLVTFAICRVIGGMALAVVTPNVLALISEYSPLSSRATLIGITNIGVPIGTILCTLIGMSVMPAHGWRILFFFAFIPIFMVVIAYFYLPDSVDSMVKKGEKSKIQKLLKKINPALALNEKDEYTVNEFHNTRKGSLTSQLKHGFARNTIIFCIMFFINIFLLFGIGSWLPKLMMNQGYNLVSGLSLLLTLNLGSFLFVPIGGKLADKFGHKPILVSYFLVASVLLYTLSFKWDIAILSILVFIIGGMINGNQSLLYAYVGVNYPLNFRLTALGGIVGF
ncbi:MFS transporter [Neobacillus drentensis]|uniref:MFS transporter n=1 Tax=Neobacillus drentensis TaxID=220684 RepID=UPI002FFF0FB3